MGRPLTKMTKKLVRELIKRWPHETSIAIAKDFKVHHTTILDWVRILKDQGVKMEKSEHYKRNTSGARKLVEKMIQEDPKLLRRK